MGKGKKAFIDRKKSVTFHLVHRSQHDPLVADENAPQRVLLEATPSNKQQDVDPKKRQEEQKKYGIQFDDDYDYLQHLKKPGQEIVWEYVENANQVKKNKNIEPKLQLPSSVFASEFEEDEGMLNKAAPRPGPRPDLDPDVVAALDDDFDFDNADNQMEDDFVVQAMGDEDDEDDDDDYYDEEDEEDFDSDDLMSSGDENEEEIRDRLAPLMRERRFDDEETKSRFTEYSMSSSVIRRNEQLTLLDDRFDKFYATYDDPEMGPLDMEEIEGTWGQKHPYVLGCYKLMKKSNLEEEYKKEWDKERLEKYRNVAEDNADDEMVELEVEDPKEKKWDCESILSTYSNIYNHPKLIDEPRKSRKIQIDPKTGLPINTLRGSDNDKLTAKALAKLDSDDVPSGGPKSLCAKSVLSTLSVLSIRPKDETAEEKKERKRLLKEYRLERRIERKANTEAFKEEKKRQTHIKINNQNNLQGKRIV
ncbi:protein LTV1 homolog [Episyrphus balteatus]|uniref:protein LTV1 homolog n=1 Tax=Episyrphus balteatus TaxID=286459 RepID=UPI002485BC99|nr:protein LTV1 homolog [Episyrphus balteatus]